jgi:hypothetical protein
MGVRILVDALTGLGAKNGVSTYFSANCEEADAAIGGRFLDSIGTLLFSLYQTTPLVTTPSDQILGFDWYVVLLSLATNTPSNHAIGGKLLDLIGTATCVMGLACGSRICFPDSYLSQE